VRGACYTPGMARFGRKRTQDSTTAATPAPEAESPAVSVVKPSRSRKPTPPAPPVLDEPPVLTSDERYAAEAVRPRRPSHDDEW
jgi:hypothetical protein